MDTATASLNRSCLLLTLPVNTTYSLCNYLVRYVGNGLLIYFFQSFFVECFFFLLCW